MDIFYSYSLIFNNYREEYSVLDALVDQQIMSLAETNVGEFLKSIDKLIAEGNNAGAELNLCEGTIRKAISRHTDKLLLIANHFENKQRHVEANGFYRRVLLRNSENSEAKRFEIFRKKSRVRLRLKI